MYQGRGKEGNDFRKREKRMGEREIVGIDRDGPGGRERGRGGFPLLEFLISPTAHFLHLSSFFPESTVHSGTLASEESH
jgi:hypothetical protein